MAKGSIVTVSVSSGKGQVKVPAVQGTSQSDAVKAITQRYHAALERLIRRNPEQYFWLHRRWKSRPAEKKAKAPLASAA